MKNTKIGFIGGGNMARSLIGGLVNSGVEAASIYVSDVQETSLQQLGKDFAVNTSPDNQFIVDQCDVVVMSVKPQVMKDVVSNLDLTQRQNILLVTIAAGITANSMQTWVGNDTAIVRAMPNTPALVQTGATGLYANNHTSAQQKELAESILRAVGIALWVDDESKMDAVTALSGSGPAYLFLVMEAMEEAGTQLGLSAETARLLAIQTAFGAAKLALEIEESPSTLRERVTSPGGTTEQALRVFNESDLKGIFSKAMQAASDRSRELAEILGK